MARLRVRWLSSPWARSLSHLGDGEQSVFGLYHVRHLLRRVHCRVPRPVDHEVKCWSSRDQGGEHTGRCRGGVAYRLVPGERTPSYCAPGFASRATAAVSIGSCAQPETKRTQRTVTSYQFGGSAYSVRTVVVHTVCSAPCGILAYGWGRATPHGCNLGTAVMRTLIHRLVRLSRGEPSAGWRPSSNTPPSPPVLLPGASVWRQCWTIREGGADPAHVCGLSPRAPSRNPHDRRALRVNPRDCVRAAR